jgi:cytoskeleton protein RodZ
MGEIGRFKTYWQDTAQARDSHSPESVASELRNARLLQGYDLAEVARSLNIREGHLEALEEGRFRDLPPLVYAKGFVAAYAGFLNLDRSEMVARFQAEATNDNSRIAIVPEPRFQFQQKLAAQPDPETRRRPNFVMAVIGLALVSFAYSLWQAGTPDGRDMALAVPPLPSRFEAPAEPLPAPTLSAEPTAEIVAQPVATTPAGYAGDGEILLRAYAEGWVQVHNAQGQRVASLVLRPGQDYRIAKSSGLRLSTGNLGAFTIIVDGRVAPLDVPTGRARTDVLLEPARLLDGTAILP